MTRRVLNDPDSHIMELPDFLTEYADPAIRNRLPAFIPVGSLDATLAGLPDSGQRGHSPETIAELKALGDQILRAFHALRFGRSRVCGLRPHTGRENERGPESPENPSRHIDPFRVPSS